MKLCVFCSANNGLDSDFIVMSQELALWAAENGHSIVFGGHDAGLMHSVSKTAKQAGGQVIGIVPRRIEEMGRLSPWLDVHVPCEDLTDRKQLMMDQSDAFIILPGGIGTLDELFTVTSMKTLGYQEKPIILWNMKGFWDSLIACLDDLHQKGVTRKQWRSYITVVRTLDEVKRALVGGSSSSKADAETYEIMAPVGSRESLAAAIQAGADSIYFGIGRLNMRAHSASVFTIDDLHEIAQTCQEHGMKSYLTVNTIIYQEDFGDMRQIIDAARKAGISAVIASDVAVMQYCRSVGIEVHLSTQLNISNIEALKFYAQFADVVVLARELRMEQVAEIYHHICDEHICGPSGELVRIEMFCHGALCMAISGKCYMSLHEANRSANRGECVQICRRSYTATDNETGRQLEIDNKYIMSPKDLKTVRFIDKMMKAGVRVFKIEGRARGPEYVHTVVRCYKEAIQSVVDGTFTDERKDEWDERLSRVFNRGFWDGYYQGQTLGEWNKNYGSNATERKVYIGKGVKYFSRLGVAEFTVEANTFRLGDKLLVTGSTTGVMYLTATEIHDNDGHPVEVAPQGTRVAIPVSGKVRPSDKLFKLEVV